MGPLPSHPLSAKPAASSYPFCDLWFSLIQVPAAQITHDPFTSFVYPGPGAQSSVCLGDCPTPTQQELLALVKYMLCAGRMAPLAQDSEPTVTL